MTALSRYRFFRFILWGAVFLVLSACSLRYTEEANTEDLVPEFSFENMSLSRYSNNTIELQINADTFEQYKGNTENYAKNADFTTWDKDGKIESQGSCKLLGIDGKNNVYTMFDDITIKNFSDNFEINANALKFNSDTEQLVSGTDDKVSIVRDDIEIVGTGFSASGVSKSFAFTTLESGTIYTNDETDNASEETDF